MSGTDLPTKIQNLEQTVRNLNTKVDALISDVAVVKGCAQTIAQFESKVEQFKKLKEATTRNELNSLIVNVEALRQLIPPANRKKEFLKQIPITLLTYWTLVAFVITVLVAVYVYSIYGVGYFETYENIASTKQSANY